jgi:hypothetical protein
MRMEPYSNHRRSSRDLPDFVEGGDWTETDLPRTRTRCECKNKACYESRGEAEFARRRMKNSGIRVFLCPVSHNHYHLGRKRSK